MRLEHLGAQIFDRGALHHRFGFPVACKCENLTAGIIFFHVDQVNDAVQVPEFFRTSAFFAGHCSHQLDRAVLAGLLWCIADAQGRQFLGPAV